MLLLLLLLTWMINIGGIPTWFPLLRVLASPLGLCSALYPTKSHITKLMSSLFPPFKSSKLLPISRAPCLRKELATTLLAVLVRKRIRVWIHHQSRQMDLPSPLHPMLLAQHKAVPYSGVRTHRGSGARGDGIVLSISGRAGRPQCRNAMSCGFLQHLSTTF